uniref:Uncharacterized protein n=1 Tax=Echinococcus canadensis TaxID=519352 RepID=A0A915EYQ2_9CEST
MKGLKIIRKALRNVHGPRIVNRHGPSSKLKIVLELDSFNFVDMRPDSPFALPSVIWLKVPYTGVLHTTQLLVPTISTQR